MIQTALIRIFVLVIIQLGINLGIAFMLREKFLKTYKVISYIVFIGIALSMPIIFFARIFLLMADTGMADSLSISVQSLDILIAYWIFNLIAVTCVQLIFNTRYLKRIVTRKKNADKANPAIPI
jgi:hypothetical protein